MHIRSFWERRCVVFQSNISKITSHCNSFPMPRVKSVNLSRKQSLASHPVIKLIAYFYTVTTFLAYGEFAILLMTTS